METIRKIYQSIGIKISRWIDEQSDEVTSSSFAIISTSAAFILTAANSFSL